jgi:hypothetical protein
MLSRTVSLFLSSQLYFFAYLAPALTAFPSIQHTNVSVASSPSNLPPDTEELLDRRQRLDAASSEIGKRLLKGWAMLSDECPNEGCYYVPLVRPPNTGGGKDPRKVITPCENQLRFD